MKEKKLVTFAILREKTPATQEDIETKLPPGVYMGWLGDERADMIEIIHSLEDDEHYAREQAFLNAEIEKVYPGESLPPQTKAERMQRARELRLELGVGVDEVLEIGEGEDDE